MRVNFVQKKRMIYIQDYVKFNAHSIQNKQNACKSVSQHTDAYKRNENPESLEN